MNKLKKLIIILIVVIILIICILIVISKLMPRKTEKTDEQKINLEDFGDEYNSEFKEVNDEQKIYQIKDCVFNYLNAVAFDNAESVCGMLDKKYMSDNSINENNAIQILKISNNYQEYDVLKLYAKEFDEYKTAYYVYGKIREKNSESSIKIGFDAIVKIDYENSTYSIIPYYGGKLNHEEIELDKIEDIEKNEYNVYVYKSIGDKVKIVNIFNNYIWDAKYYLEDAYNSIDQSYREKRFGSLEAYTQYVQENIENIKKFKLEEYQIIQKDGYKQYVCKDNYGNYYIFNVTSVMQYSVMLDTYIIPQEEFFTKYKEGSAEVKVGMNVEKFIEMINMKDYNAAYAVLSDGFKNNYFPTIESFEEYVKNNFFEFNSLEHSSFETEGGVYIHKVTISDKADVATESIQKEFIMQLKSGTDFVMSFNVE